MDFIDLQVKKAQNNSWTISGLIVIIRSRYKLRSDFKQMQWGEW